MSLASGMSSIYCEAFKTQELIHLFIINIQLNCDASKENVILAPDGAGIPKCVNIYMYMYHYNTTQ